METAQVWTVIGLLAATLLGLLTVFGGGLNALRNDMQGMRGDLRDNTKQLAELTVKVGSLDTRVGLLENKVEGHDRRFDSLEEQISRHGRILGDAIYGLTEQFREHLRLHAS